MTQPHIRLKVRKLRTGLPDLAYMTKNAAAFDLSAAIDHPMALQPMERRLIPTGLALEIPEGFEGQIRPRSGTSFKKGLTMINSPGTIDADYRGEISIIAINLGRDPILIAPLERIAQMVIAPILQVAFEYVDTLEPSARGAGGFGSTGT